MIFHGGAKSNIFVTESWQNHEEIETVKWIQAKSADDSAAPYEGEKEVFESSGEEEAAGGEYTKDSQSKTESENDSDSEGVSAVQSNKFSALNDE